MTESILRNQYTISKCHFGKRKPFHVYNFMFLNKSIVGKYCGHPSSPENGRITWVTGYYFEDRVDYQCDIGHNITGNSSSWCTDYGHWSEIPLGNGLYGKNT